MNVMTPTEDLVPGLRKLWKAAFGDEDTFLNIFFGYAFTTEACRCIVENGKPVAALYWFDCELEEQDIAYIYAVATDPACRGRGLCRALMDDTMEYLKHAGYAGAVLVPQEPWLIKMYKRMGFESCTMVTEFHAMAADAPVPVCRIQGGEYGWQRAGMLPAGGVEQWGSNLSFLHAQAAFFASVPEGRWLAACTEVDGMLWCPEFLGDPSAAPGLVKALGYREGSFRMPGSERPFAMFRPLTEDCPRPRYFGLAFD